MPQTPPCAGWQHHPFLLSVLKSLCWGPQRAGTASVRWIAGDQACASAALPELCQLGTAGRMGSDDVLTLPSEEALGNFFCAMSSSEMCTWALKCPIGICNAGEFNTQHLGSTGSDRERVMAQYCMPSRTLTRMGWHRSAADSTLRSVVCMRRSRSPVAKLAMTTCANATSSSLHCKGGRDTGARGEKYHTRWQP